MSEFQLYKKRDFSALVGDTLQFFKQFWKNYFSNYVILNGALLLLMMLLYFLLFKDSFQNMYRPNVNGSWIMYNDNPILFAMLGLLFTAIAIAFGVVSTAFPMVYLKLMSSTEKDSFTATEIFNKIKGYAGRLILFGIISMFIMVPIGLIVFIVGGALSIILIGIPLLILALPTIIIWSMQSMYVYIEEGAGYFEALGKGWKITFNKYWHVVGSTIIVFIIIMVVSSIFSIVPMISMFSAVITSGGRPEAMVMTPTMLVFYIIGMIFSFLANNILYMQQGLVYYSSKENTAHYQAFSDIDNIGKNEE